MTERNEDLAEVFLPYMDDFVLCEKKIAKHSKSFYRAFSQLPKQKALSVFAIYSFCREADDSIDQYQDINRLNQLRQELDKFLLGEIPDRYFWRAMYPVFSTYSMNSQAFYDMLEGQERDYHFQQPTTAEELNQYCYYVAGSVGLMLLPILSKQADDLSELAIQLGQAMQLTNILRDVGEDLDHQRIYLPRETMANFGMTKEALMEKVVSERFILLWEHYAQQAEQLYEEAMYMVSFINADCREAFLLSLLFYREILNAVRKNNYQCFIRKNYVKKTQKIKLLKQAKKYLKK